MQTRSASSTQNDTVAPRQRLYFLDWMRVFAILLVFCVHCAKIFDYHTTVVVNPVPSPVLSALRDALFIWLMPLFFVLSGAAIFLSRGPAHPRAFIRSRFLRLVIPLIFVGTFVVNAVYVYIERLSAGQAAGGFFQWYPRYFQGVYGFGGNFVPLGQGTHLWYLEFLFIYSIVLLPFFIPSRKRGTSVLASLARHLGRPWALLGLFLPVSAISAGLEAAGLGGIRAMGGWDPLSYLLFLVYGYLLFANPRIGETIRRHAPAYLAAAIVLTVLFVDSHLGFVLKIPGLTRHDLQNNGALLPRNPSLWVAAQAARGLASWSWILGLLGLGSRYMNFNGKLLAYANEAVLPFYILHHAVIYVVGHQVIGWNASVAPKFVAISLISFAITIALYEVMIRRVGALRFLFGMKRRSSCGARSHGLLARRPVETGMSSAELDRSGAP